MTLKERKQKEIERVLDVASRQEIVEYFTVHDYVETRKYFTNLFMCSHSVFDAVWKILISRDEVITLGTNRRISTNKGRYGAGTKPRKPHIDRETLYQYYIIDFLSIDEIIKRFDNKYTRTQIKNALHDYNIHRTKKGNPNYRWGTDLKEKHIDSFMRKYGVSSPMKVSEVVQKGQRTKVERYGEDWKFTLCQKSFETYRERTGLDNPFQDVNHLKASVVEKYGVTHNTQIPGVVEKAKQTKFDRYGNANYNNTEKAKQTNLEKYGVEHVTQSEAIKEKIRQTNLEKYGVEYTLLLPQVNNKQRVHSKPNEQFYKLLEDSGLEYKRDFDREFVVGRRIYDFKIGNYLIEIDPSATHNSTWNPWIDGGINKYYHQEKSKIAQQCGYRCIHVFDWMDKGRVIENILSEKYSMNISFESPRTFYYSFKEKSLCASDTPKCVLIYDDGAVEDKSYSSVKIF